MANLLPARVRVRFGVAIAVAAIAAVSLTACSPASPAPSPSASATPTQQVPVPEPTVTVDANGRALPGFVTASLELPPAQAAQSTTLANAGPGWVLATYRPQVGSLPSLDGPVGGNESSVQVVYLGDPDGRRYQLLELDPTAPIIIDSWTPGETIAYVRACEPDDCAPETPTQILDLTTGELSAGPLEGAGPGGRTMHVTATLPGSVRWWEDGTSAVIDRDGVLKPFGRAWTADSVSPSGRYLAVQRTDDFSEQTSAGLAVISAETGDITDIAFLWTEPLTCEVFRWRPDDTLDIVCDDPVRDITRVFAVGPGAEEAKENKTASPEAPAEGPWVRPDVVVTDGVWAGPYSADAESRKPGLLPQLGLARNAGFEPLVVPDASVRSAEIVAAHNGSLYIQGEASRTAQPGLRTAWRYDVADGRWYPLMPMPPGGLTRGLAASEGAPAWGMTSWVVGS